MNQKEHEKKLMAAQLESLRQQARELRQERGLQGFLTALARLPIGSNLRGELQKAAMLAALGLGPDPMAEPAQAGFSAEELLRSLGIAP